MRDHNHKIIRVEVPEDKLYFKDVARSLCTFPVGVTEIERVCFLHRGHLEPNVPQLDYWTVSDVETGLGIASGETVVETKENARGALGQTKLMFVIASILTFIDQHGRTNYARERPVIREGSVVVWREDGELTRAKVASKRDHIADEGVACLITHHPTKVVLPEDVLYVWPTQEDLVCLSN